MQVKSKEKRKQLKAIQRILQQIFELMLYFNISLSTKKTLRELVGELERQFQTSSSLLEQNNLTIDIPQKLNDSLMILESVLYSPKLLGKDKIKTLEQNIQILSKQIKN
jgi:hypothetical protein